MKVWSFAAGPDDPRFPQVAATDHAFRRRGYEVAPFTFADLGAGRLDADLLRRPGETVVWGPIGAVAGALDRAGRPRPPLLDFPAELAAFLGRRVRAGRLGEVRASDAAGGPARWPVHVKPRTRHKLFPGVAVRAFRDLLPVAHLPADEPVWVQECIELRSEWRAIVLRGEVVHVAHYGGDPLAFPDPAAVAAGAAAFGSAPVAYGADWGVTAAGKTVLVEVNDGYSLGNYGCPGHLYTAALECRWRELNGLPDSGVGLG